MMSFISTVFAQKLNHLNDPIETPTEALAFIGVVANWFFAILITVAVIFIILAAFTYLKSGGGEDTAKAHKKLIYAAIAVGVGVLAKGIVLVAGNIVGGNIKL